MSGKPTFEVLARAAAQLAAIDDFALELEVPINADDQQLFEVALALNQNLVAGLFGRDSLDLNALAVNRAVRPRPEGSGRYSRNAARRSRPSSGRFPSAPGC